MLITRVGRILAPYINEKKKKLLKYIENYYVFINLTIAETQIETKKKNHYK